MSYNVSGSGHGADPEKIKKAFADFVRAADDATREGGNKFAGQLSANEGGVTGFNYTADDVRKETPVASQE